MWYNIGILVFLLVVYFILDIGEQHGAFSRERSKKYMIRIAALLLILQSGMRNIAVGPDTYAYSLKFVDSLSESWQSVFRNFISVYVLDEGKDAGYYLIQKVFSTVIPSFQCFLLLIAFLFFYAFFAVIDHYTSSKKEVYLSVFVYLSLFYEFFSVTGCRQVLATAFCLFSVKYIREKKLIPFLLIMLVAFSIHRSSLIFVPFYFVSRNPKPRIVYLVSLFLMPILIVISARYATELAVLSGTDIYMMYAEGGAVGARTFLLFYLVICTFLLIIQNSVIRENPDDLLVYNAMYLALLFIPLTFSSAALMRVVQYYSLFLTIGIPFFTRKSLKIRYGGILVVFLIVSLIALLYKLSSNSIEYKLFWQHMALPAEYMTNVTT